MTWWTALWQKFLSTLSLRRATTTTDDQTTTNDDFYPRSPCGERPITCKCRPAYQKFLSTLSLRRATDTYIVMEATEIISIHALLAESDTIFAVRPYDAPIFLSTLSLRRATFDTLAGTCRLSFLSTLSLRRATLAACDGLADAVFLSTLSLRRATTTADCFSKSTLFLSTLSLRRATVARCVVKRNCCNFYPRSPCGERHPDTSTWQTGNHLFLSTLSLRRATVPPVLDALSKDISIHALLAESDTSLVVIGTNCVISIHALLAESDVNAL